MTSDEVVELLTKEYGHQEWHPRADPISELIFTILSQHTADTNSKRAFRRLLDSFGSWQAIAEGEVERIEEAILSGGLGRVKAVRIKAVLQEILKQKGSFDLSFLAPMKLEGAKAWLRSLPGVGPKTAACVLLFSLGRPVIPVDTHLHRVARRLGLIGDRVSPEEAHELLEAQVPPEARYQFHVSLIEHGRKICRAQHPRCALCPLRHGCPSAFRFP